MIPWGGEINLYVMGFSNLIILFGVFSIFVLLTESLKGIKMKKDKHIDYYDVIIEQEKKSHELANKIDRETSAEDRVINMANRIKNIEENRGR